MRIDRYVNASIVAIYHHRNSMLDLERTYDQVRKLLRELIYRIYRHSFYFGTLRIFTWILGML